jgi:hypothetical protein
MMRFFATLPCAAVVAAVVGCGGADAPPASQLSDQQRQEMIKRDAERVMQERTSVRRPQQR